jgi:hypothetical protein
VNTQTREREKRDLLDPKMKAAQSLSPDDFKKAEEWSREMRLWIKKECK